MYSLIVAASDRFVFLILFQIFSQNKKINMFSDLLDDDLLSDSLGLPPLTLTETMVNINNHGEYIKLLKWTDGIRNDNYI
jgi:hypothetical protein